MALSCTHGQGKPVHRTLRLVELREHEYELFRDTFSWLQAPDIVKARMYKILKEVVEEHQQGKEGSSAVPCRT